MQEVFKKITDELNKFIDSRDARINTNQNYNGSGGFSKAIEIVNQVASEVGGGVCKHKYHRTIDDVRIYQLMSASEAREKSSGNISRTCQSELQAAMEYIYNSVNDGKTECWCYTYLHEQCINKLRELGYDVSNHSTQREGTLFKISWSKGGRKLLIKTYKKL